jgi:hypothetical protein
MLPDAPLEEVPLLKMIEPLTPLVPLLLVLMLIDPLDLATPSPDSNDIAPPVATLLTPEVIEISPPAEPSPWPTLIPIFPALPLVLLPENISI